MKPLCNPNFAFLEDSYLFSWINHEVSAYKSEHKNAKVISLGIGDVTLPLPKVAVDAMKNAAEEMGTAKGFHGYPPQGGYPYLRQAVARWYQETRGCDIEEQEVFVTDGAKSQLSGLMSLFAPTCVLLPTPNYPVYHDIAILNGFSVETLEANADNQFLPLPNSAKKRGYVIFLCSPANPTGMAYTKEQLEEWVAFARNSDSVILFDMAYEAYITDSRPHSIFEIEGAKDCAIEIGSFSKAAGFTGVRCGWTVIPLTLTDGQGQSLHKKWVRREATTQNGVSYITQRGAEAVFSEAGQRQMQERVSYYMKNARLLKACLDSMKLTSYGGVHSPYLWVFAENRGRSMDIFKQLLTKCQLVTTPGVGFGKGGEGYIRLSSFGSREHTKEACNRLLSFSFT